MLHLLLSSPSWIPRAGTPYPTGVVSTPEGQLLVRRDVDEIVDKVHHLNGFVKRRTGNPPGGPKGCSSDASNAAFALKTLIEAEDGQIRELTRLSLETGSLDKSLVSKRVNEFLEIETHVSASRAAISAAFPNDPQVKAAENNVKTKDTLFLNAIQKLALAPNPAKLKSQLKSVTDQRVPLLKGQRRFHTFQFRPNFHKSSTRQD
ncbi:hypothetical protein Pst134EB_023587 [Puccinia striiformis f. sp. tritici]|nr:hypothetical protein Pst134EB_023587 [Puccinia striiformis f. sp. tritici]